MEYNKILKINETFQYSINLQFDINDIKKIQEYIPTKDSCQVLENYVDSLLGNFSKSTTLIGPYGKGKSHLLLILLTIFNESGPLIRIIEIAPTPRAVDIAAIVSFI